MGKVVQRQSPILTRKNFERSLPGMMLEGDFQREWRDDEDRATRLVVIGETGLDEAAIRASLAGA